MPEFDLNTITASMGSQLDKVQGTLSTANQALQANPNDMKATLSLQTAMNTWTNMIALQSSLVKSVGDAFRGIIQKMP